MVLNSSTLTLQQCCTIALSLPPSLPPQHPLQRGGEGLITALSRNWSMFNSSGWLTGYTHEMAFGCLFFLIFYQDLHLPGWCGSHHKLRFSRPKSWFYYCSQTGLTLEDRKPTLRKSAVSSRHGFGRSIFHYFWKSKVSRSLYIIAIYRSVIVAFFPTQETHHSSQYSIKSKTWFKSLWNYDIKWLSIACSTGLRDMLITCYRFNENAPCNRMINKALIRHLIEWWK